MQSKKTAPNEALKMSYVKNRSMDWSEIPGSSKLSTFYSLFFFTIVKNYNSKKAGPKFLGSRR